MGFAITAGDTVEFNATRIPCNTDPPFLKLPEITISFGPL